MKIIFTGDLSSTGNFEDAIKKNKNIISKEITSHFNNADYVHVNLENPITESGVIRQSKKGIALKAPIELVNLLKKNNINICTLANNHIMDYGDKGLQNTIDILDVNDIIYYGIDNDKKYTILEKDNSKIALITSAHKEGPCATKNKKGPQLFKLIEIEKILNDIKLKHNPDTIVYNYHGGTEFNIIPEKNRKLFFRSLIDLGVDIVIGHHSHVPQGIENYGNGIIVYGLGNLIFDLSYHKRFSFSSLSYYIEYDSIKKRIRQYFYTLNSSSAKINYIEDKKMIEILNDRMNCFDSIGQYFDAWLLESIRVLFLYNYIDEKNILGSYRNEFLKAFKARFPNRIIFTLKFLKMWIITRFHEGLRPLISLRNIISYDKILKLLE